MKIIRTDNITADGIVDGGFEKIHTEKQNPTTKQIYKFTKYYQWIVIEKYPEKYNHRIFIGCYAILYNLQYHYRCGVESKLMKKTNKYKLQVINFINKKEIWILFTEDEFKEINIKVILKFLSNSNRILWKRIFKGGSET